MSDLTTVTVTGLGNFWIGCVGAIAPETFRLYNLRTQPVLRWSAGYLLFSIPFILVGGFVAWILEPTTKWAAFYSGLTAPVLLTTVMKDTAKAQKELVSTQTEIKELEQNLSITEEKKKELETEISQLRLTVELLEAEKRPITSTTFALKGSVSGEAMMTESCKAPLPTAQDSMSRSNNSQIYWIGAIAGVIITTIIGRFINSINILWLLIGSIAVIAVVVVVTQILRRNHSFSGFS